ncbi:antileukoproteinase-like [Suricata suricatta]|uniref:antileukoproteinase-like n=1 Tax=Suricata suricatta TaxID=37032 RepID=UPI0011553ACB|nr:antileukoproteinase-like [Suricata suricatta]
MKASSLFTFTVLLALNILTSWTVESTTIGEAKSGDCPDTPQYQCLVYEPGECQSDWQCLGKKKCCYIYCSTKCMDPVDPAKQVKVNPGRCPVVIGECKEPNPTDTCLNDGDSLDNLKCCKEPCGWVFMC